jgi:N-acetylglutamate synthase-like GNAT family acetyltransferase
MPEIIISTDKSTLDIPLIHQFLSEDSYWAKGIPLETVKRSIDNSLCFGIYKDNKQIGFARIISDLTTFAYLADVFNLPAHRKQGLSKRLVKEILAHPDLQGLRAILLGTLDAHELYRQFGFKELAKPERFMEIRKPGIYMEAGDAIGKGNR